MLKDLLSLIPGNVNYGFFCVTTWFLRFGEAAQRPIRPHRPAYVPLTQCVCAVVYMCVLLCYEEAGRSLNSKHSKVIQGLQQSSARKLYRVCINSTDSCTELW